MFRLSLLVFFAVQAQFLLALDGTAATERWSEQHLTKQVLARELLSEIKVRDDDQKKLEQFKNEYLSSVSYKHFRLAHHPILVTSQDQAILSAEEMKMIETTLGKMKASSKKEDLDSLIKSGFDDDTKAKSIKSLLGSHAESLCSLKKMTVKQYLSHQQKVISVKRQAYAPELIKYLKVWKKPRVHCLISHLASRYIEDRNATYLTLSLTLLKFHPEYKNDIFLRNMVASHYLIDRQHAESLRQLFELQSVDPRYKLLYQMVQRQYSLTQKGKGEVSIKSL